MSSRVSCWMVLASVVAVAAGCNSGASLQLTPAAQSFGPSAPGLQTDMYPSAARAEAALAEPDDGHAWMSPDAKKTDLLYVTDIKTNKVDVYTFPHGKRVGKLKGFNAPIGACSDIKTGNVFITDQDAHRIVEFAHGGTAPIATLNDPNQFPAGCSVDLTTGDLAVTNITGTKGTSGSVSLYTGAKGKAKILKISTIKSPYFCGYDKTGDLFVDGTSEVQGGNFEFAELASGTTKFKSVELLQTIAQPGNVQWDGRHIAVMDTSDDTIYRFKLKGSNATLAATTKLTGSGQGQFWIIVSRNDRRAHKVVMPDELAGDVGFFKYPGGKGIKAVHRLKKPLGSTVSLK